MSRKKDSRMLNATAADICRQQGISSLKNTESAAR